MSRRIQEYRVLLHKTWEELYDEADEWDPHDLEKQPFPPPPNHVRVEWYPSLDAVDEWGATVNCVVAEFALEPSGELNLKMVREYWHMDKVIPIDPLRFRPFEPSNPDKLSALAVHTLTGYNGRLSIIDRPKPETQEMRALRLRIINRFYDFNEWRSQPFIRWLFNLLVVLLCCLLWWQLFCFVYQSIPATQDRQETFSAAFVGQLGRWMGKGV